MEQQQIKKPTTPDSTLFQNYHQKLDAWMLKHPDAKHAEVTQQARKIAEEVGI